MYIYAVINENGVCCLFHTSETEINDASYILVEAADSNMVYRKKWDAETETWVDTEPNSGSMITLSTNNLPTQIAGSAVYSSKAISVSSDRRLKDDVRHVNKEAFVDFIKKINLVSYRYKEEPADTKHIGVIAQQLLEINKDLASYFVCEDRDGYYSVDYAALALVAAAVALQ